MLKTIDEIKEAEIEAGVVVNGVDNPNVMSMDSTEPSPTKADGLKLTKEQKLEEPFVEEDEVELEPELESEEEGEEEEESDSEPEPELEPEPEESKPNDSPSVAKRIGKLTKNWRTAEREAEYQKEKRLEAEAKLKELQKSTPADDKPLKEDFDDEDDYIEALTDWKIDNRLKASQENAVEEIEDKEEREAVAQTYEGIDDAIEKGKEKYNDFDDVVFNEDLVVGPELTQIALDSEVPEEILYYLGSNPEESARISELDPVKIGIEVGRIEARLVAKTTAKPKVTKKTSKAPKPITPIKTTGAVEKNPEEMSTKEYRAWRESQSK